MALAQCSDQQFLGVVAVGIAAECRIGGRENVGPALGLDHIVI